MIITWRFVLLSLGLGFALGLFAMRNHDNNVKNAATVKTATDYQKLQIKLNASDLTLFNAQVADGKNREIIVNQKEIVYRDKIKNPDTVKCIADSGLLDLYDTTMSTGIK